MTIYKNQIGVLARIRERVRFAGEDVLIVEMITPLDHHGSIRVFRHDAFGNWASVAIDEWDQAVTAATSASRGRAAAEKTREDEERYGIVVSTRGRFGSEGETVIVRSTKTMYFDISGRRWSRRTRKRTGDGFVAYLAEDSADALEAFLDGRERVDIVAERKAAAKAADS